jgi:integrative and conjugative element protein (TIGR02256 family)
VAYVATYGTVVSLGELAIPKAKELARYVSSGVHPYVSLIEARRLGSRESLVLSFTELEVGQAPIVPVLNEEWFEIAFGAEDDYAPQVLALRTDFPNAPHVNRTFEEIPRSLCLYDAPWNETKLSWTAGRFVERIRVWIRDTARGVLHRNEQPLEPVLLATAHTLLLPADLFANPEDETPNRLLIVGKSQTSAGTVLAAIRTELASQQDRGEAQPIVSTLIACEPRVHGLIRHVPRNLGELHALHTDFGRDLVADLRKKLLDWRRPDAPLQSHLLIISRFPRQRLAGQEPETTDVWAFLCGTVEEVGAAVGAWEKRGSSVGALLNVAIDEEQLKKISIDVLNTAIELSRARAATANGCEPSIKKIVAVGAGALGSQVIPLLVRAGFGTWAVIDNDVLLPHNMARHVLTAHYVGHPKADALSHDCNHIIGDKAMATGIVADVLKPGDAAEIVSKALAEAEVIADFSASVSVARYLAHIDVPGRRLSAYMSPSGTDLIVLVEDSNRTLRLDHLEMQYYRAVLHAPALAGHMRTPAGRIQYAQSCRDVSAVVSNELVSMHAAIAAKQIRKGLSTSDASISIWSVNDDSVTRISAEPVDVQEASIGDWRVISDLAVVQTVSQSRASRLPRETGGVLIGAIDTQRKRVYVVDVLQSPPDSVEWPTVYIRGVQGLAERAEQINHATGGMVHYIGEWHSHPVGASASASSTDQDAFAKLSALMAVEGLPALLLIVGERDHHWYLGWVDV